MIKDIIIYSTGPHAPSAEAERAGVSALTFDRRNRLETRRLGRDAKLLTYDGTAGATNLAAKRDRAASCIKMVADRG